jgi:hypothetical protein
MLDDGLVNNGQNTNIVCIKKTYLQQPEAVGEL